MSFIKKNYYFNYSKTQEEIIEKYSSEYVGKSKQTLTYEMTMVIIMTNYWWGFKKHNKIKIL